MTYPARWIDLQHFFRRSEGWLSEVCEAVRLHLDKIARKLLIQFDHKRIVPLIPVFAAAFKAKGCPLPYVWALLDGTFRDFCRPCKDGYSGLAQRVQYSGHKHAHGNNHQGLETSDGIIIEMHGPFEGPMNDQRMFKDSGLLARLMAHCAILTLVGPAYILVIYYLFADRGYTHGNPYVQVPYKAPVLLPYQTAYNGVMSKIRQPVEWSFGKVGRYFAFVDFEKNQKLYLQPVTSYWQIATLLTNCHSCFYGNQTATYFGVPTPEVEDLLKNGF